MCTLYIGICTYVYNIDVVTKKGVQEIHFYVILVLIRHICKFARVGIRWIFIFVNIHSSFRFCVFII